jgi:hypothetical protein
MAHKEQKAFFQELSRRFSDIFTSASRILEVGSQNINGSVRDFFPNAREYLGIDLGLAANVDWVVPGELVELPDGWSDIAISTECFEHCEHWKKVFINMIRISAPRSLVIITCAGLGRPTHGTIDSDEFSSPFTSGFYKNLAVDDIAHEIATGVYFTNHAFEVNSLSKDLYFWGIRSEAPIQSSDHYWEDLMSRLARAQGQLGQAATRHAVLQSELDSAKIRAAQAGIEADQARAEADQARAEADQASAEADQARAEADQARAEADQARAEADQARAEADNISLQFKKIQESRTWRLTGIIRTLLDKIKRVIQLRVAFATPISSK